MRIVSLIINGNKRENGIILDFFSGSGTSAHAVMQLNAEDNGHRKYILMQLPAETGETSEAYKMGYKTICDIGEERIRRAGKKIKEETGADIDYGFWEANTTYGKIGVKVWNYNGEDLMDSKNRAKRSFPDARPAERNDRRGDRRGDRRYRY